MRPLKEVEIAFNKWSFGPNPELIKKPKSIKKHKSWCCYYNWWLDQQTVERWMALDCSMPFQRSDIFQP